MNHGNVEILFSFSFFFCTFCYVILDGLLYIQQQILYLSSATIRMFLWYPKQKLLSISYHYFLNFFFVYFSHFFTRPPTLQLSMHIELFRIYFLSSVCVIFISPYVIAIPTIREKV